MIANPKYEGINPCWNTGRAVCLGVRPALSGLLIGTEAPPSEPPRIRGGVIHR